MKSRYLLLLLPFTFFLNSCGHGGGTATSANLDKSIDTGKELASLGNAQVHQGFLDLLGRVNPNIEGQLKTPAGKKRLVDSLLEQELFYNESVKRGIDKLPQVQEKTALYERVIVSQALLDEEIKKKAKDYYDANKDQEFSRVKVSQILIRITPPSLTTPLKPGQMPPKPDIAALDAQAMKKAQEAKAKLDGGASWEEVVNTYSDDPMSKSKGGDMGYLSKQDRRASRMGWDELVTKAFSMKVGEISQPIQAKDGVHIIKLTEGPQVAPLEEVETSIEFKLRPQVKNELLTALTKGKATDYEDEELKGVATMPPPAAPGVGVPGAPMAPGPQQINIQQPPGGQAKVSVQSTTAIQQPANQPKKVPVMIPTVPQANKQPASVSPGKPGGPKAAAD